MESYLIAPGLPSLEVNKGRQKVDKISAGYIIMNYAVLKKKYLTGDPFLGWYLLYYFYLQSEQKHKQLKTYLIQTHFNSLLIDDIHVKVAIKVSNEMIGLRKLV